METRRSVYRRRSSFVGGEMSIARSAVEQLSAVGKCCAQPEFEVYLNSSGDNDKLLVRVR